MQTVKINNIKIYLTMQLHDLDESLKNPILTYNPDWPI